MAIKTHLVNTIADLVSATENPKADLIDGQQITVAGYYAAGDNKARSCVWVAASTATVNGGTVFAHDDGGTGRFLFEADVVTATDFGITGSGDKATQFQALVTWAGANGKTWILDKAISVGSTIYIAHHGAKGECHAEITYTGTGYCIDFTRVGNAYPVSLNFNFIVRLTATAQYGMAERYSYSDVRCAVTMNAEGCTNCIGVRSLGDVPHGSGPYYNRNVFRFQGSGRAGSISHTTEPSDGDFTSGRGPNACLYRIERSGQMLQHVVDRVGAGNRWEIQTAEGSSAYQGTLITAGHDTKNSVVNNQYIVQYTEVVQTTFNAPADKFSAGLVLQHFFATGGSAVIDPLGVLTRASAPNLFRETGSLLRTIQFRSTPNASPRFQSAGQSGIILENLVADQALTIQESLATSNASHALRLYANDTEFLRAGTMRLTPVTDSTKSLGEVDQRWAQVFGTNFRPGAGTATWTAGSGSPEGVTTATLGSLYTRTDAPGGTYEKLTDSGNTGWHLLSSLSTETATTVSAATGNVTLVTAAEFGKRYAVKIEETTAMDGDPKTFRLGTSAGDDSILGDVTATGTAEAIVYVDGAGQDIVLSWVNTAGTAGELTSTVKVMG